MKRLLLIVLAAAAALSAQAPAGASGGGRGRGPAVPLVKSPEVAADGRVTVRLRAPNAKEVTVNGIPGIGPFKMDDQGVWTATSAEPVPPEVYEYTFRIDGVQVPDLSNPMRHQNFAGNAGSILQVKGTDPWSAGPGPRGTVTRHFFHSGVIGDDREFYVYTPPNYDRNRKEAYPVLYLLHGNGDDASGWQYPGMANVILDNLINQGKAKPMIMVNTLGYGAVEVVAALGLPRTPDSNMRNMVNFQKSLFEEVIPVVEKDYNASKNRTQRAIAGLSMGGGEALYSGLNNLDRFSWIGGFSSGLTGTAFDTTYPTVDAKTNSKLNLLYISCGTADNLITVNRQLKDWLKTKGVKFVDVESAGGHTWPNWRHYLAEFAPMLFQK